MVEATGTLAVSGSKVAITGTGTSATTITVDNYGVIKQTGTGRAMRDVAGGLNWSITNTGTITSAGADTFQINVAGSSVTLINSGTIAALGTGGSNGQALDWAALSTNTGTSSIFNEAGGSITAADADAIRAGQNSVIHNDGLIKGFSIGDSGNDGIDAQTNTNVTIVNAYSNNSASANLIEGASHGITGGNTSGTGSYTMSITNNAFGTIKGDNGSGINIDGINANEQVTIINHGLVSGNGITGDGDGVDVDGCVIITNTGTIISNTAFNDTSEGVTVGGGTINNSGTIEGSVINVSGTNTALGRGITLAGIDKDSNDNAIPVQKIYEDSSITNSGLIKGDTDSGIAILGVSGTTNYSVTITNTLGGVIEGGGAVAVIDGSADVTVGGTTTPIGTASQNNETVINYGTIKADGSGKAISLGSGNNIVEIEGPAASIIGDISGGALTGTNTAALTIDPTSGHSFSYGGVISSFTSVEVESGTVTFSGANTYDGTTTIDANAILDLTGSGTIGTTTTLTLGSNSVFDLGGKTETVDSLVNSGGSINNGTVNVSNTSSTGTSTISGLSGSTSVDKTGSYTTVITGTNTYTGGTTVSDGKLEVDGSIVGNVNVHSGAEVGGHGSIGGTIGGAGAVGPGNSPGILTAAATDPTTGLSYNFEFTQTGAPVWSNASASGNDVLHLLSGTPFSAPLTSANDINVYFGAFGTYEGGFFTNGSTNDLTSNIANATYNYFILDNADGTISYNGNEYDVLSSSDVLASTLSVTGADFADGTVNGWTQEFSVGAVPEPSPGYALVGLAATWALVIVRRHVFKRA